MYKRAREQVNLCVIDEDALPYYARSVPPPEKRMKIEELSAEALVRLSSNKQSQSVPADKMEESVNIRKESPTLSPASPASTSEEDEGTDRPSKKNRPNSEKTLVCKGSVKRKNKKPRPEDQFMVKFSMKIV
ncbi:hypothetical protein AKO1_000214 [Acrasis kona]|uniref:Uncharacterized protein n=1 Tax=Acrasis kona TaxID=1008807 RepID=A0AAW2ZCU9_9EUKA